ncbi:MAG: hypothetical protein L6Q54_11860 [Leptospiraceae bacterium]|nr:hypothetical protein [Leptospiraceae bacterium]MCK6381925.1 hypothetical protein [Leptospiraceae bacterium]NUM42292.1 hypothetical protein [Leptospiraceae bacterium]
MKVFFSFCILAISIFAGEQDERNDFKRLYKLPHEVINSEELSKLSTLKNDPATSPDKLIEEVTNILNKYYSQFIGEKRIWEDKLRGGKYNIKSDPASIQAFIHELLTGQTNSGRTRDSEILYNLHIELASQYEKKQIYHKAIESYLQGFRYKNFKPTEEYYISDKRWSEISDKEEILKKDTHKINFTELKKSEFDLKKLQDDFHEMESNYAKNKINRDDFSLKKFELQNKIKSQTNLLKEKEDTYSNSKKSNYDPFYKKQIKENSAVLLRFAKIVKIIENENKERQKIINKTSTVGKGIFVLFDYKRNTDFHAYKQILELAYRIDPENEEVIKSIADESLMAGQKQTALDFYLKHENLINTNSSNSSNGKETDLKIAILYSDLKRYVLAGNFYERYLQKETDPKKKSSIEFEIAGFYEKQLGNFEKSALHYQNWLNYVATIDESTLSFSDSLELKTGKFNAYHGISKFLHLQKYSDQEKENLYKARELSIDLQKNLDNETKNHVTIRKELLETKKDLLASTNDEVLAKYRLLEIRQNEAIDKINIIKTKYKKIKLIEVLSRLCALEESERNLNQVRSIYEEILQIGTEEDIAHSIKNITRLDSIQRDGIYREPEF